MYVCNSIEELQMLWHERIWKCCYPRNQFFQMHAILLWKVHHFLKYAYWLRWNIKFKLACPIYYKHTYNHISQHSKKMWYMGHSWWLPLDYPYKIKMASTPTKYNKHWLLEEEKYIFSLPNWEHRLLRHNWLSSTLKKTYAIIYWALW